MTATQALCLGSCGRGRWRVSAPLLGRDPHLSPGIGPFGSCGNSPFERRAEAETLLPRRRSSLGVSRRPPRPPSLRRFSFPSLQGGCSLFPVLLLFALLRLLGASLGVRGIGGSSALSGGSAVAAAGVLGLAGFGAGGGGGLAFVQETDGASPRRFGHAGGRLGNLTGALFLPFFFEVAHDGGDLILFLLLRFFLLPFGRFAGFGGVLFGGGSSP
mmetsp:Transcript_14917/g.33131  ORF Transcript_14917/g.33131 Transcript_14917/m.33131 type:complete len:215 (-) Transcript_14917:2599-3243(-)